MLVVTVDRVAGRNQETLFRLRREDTRNCQDCHQPGIVARARRRPNYDGIDLSRMTSMESANMTWDFFKRVRDITRMKILVKGVLAHEDATLCVENGLDGMIVSNHGARGEDSGRSTIDALPEIVEAVRGRIPVLVDSGFRRGTDIVKGLALGASAVCVGRPYLWGLGAFGQPGVERVLELLRTELQAAMQQCGVRSLRESSRRRSCAGRPERGAILLRGRSDRLAFLDDVGGEHLRRAAADVLPIVHLAGFDEESVARLQRPRRLAVDFEQQRSFDDVAELLAGMRVPARSTAGDELRQRLHCMALRHAEVVVLQQLAREPRLLSVPEHRDCGDENCPGHCGFPGFHDPSSAKRGAIIRC